MRPSSRATRDDSVREQLRALLDAVPDDQVDTVLSFVTALSRGRAVVSACDVPEDDAGPLMGAPSAGGLAT